MHVDVSRAYFHAKAQGPVLVKLPAEDCSGKDRGKNRTAEEKHVRYQRCSKQFGNEIGKGISKIGVTSWGAVQETCTTTRKGKHRVRRDDFVVTGTKERLLELKKQLESVCPITASIIGEGSTKSVKALNRRTCW